MSRALPLVDDAFRRADARAAVPPTRFLLNLTERCQLRCAHCITGAPDKTARGQARDMGGDVVERLGPHLAHATYVGLVHAGEPMLAPMFEPLLERLQAERAGAPVVVHLLSNGMAMTGERFRRCLSLGVTSFSFSLDGMSAATNDVLRIGARADVLVERIRALSAQRPGHVRMGISWVVTSANADELPALVRFAQDAGLDWLKLEEIFPTTEHARALSLERFALDVAVARARDEGEALGVPVLDHTRPLAVWKCRLDLDRRMATRARLDDLVNRADLNPCRLPWEVVCVEPDGDVKPLSFHHPVAGNVLVDDLADIFRGDVFAEVRRTVRATRLCGEGPATCAADAGPSSW